MLFIIMDVKTNVNGCGIFQLYIHRENPAIYGLNKAKCQIFGSI